MLLVFDREENLVAVLENGNKNACPYYNGKVKSILNAEQTLSFKVPYEHEDAKKIIEHGYIARKNKYGQWQLFLVTELIQNHSENIEIEVFAEGSFIELDNVFIEYQFHDRKTPAVVLPALLMGTRWEAGTIEGVGIHDLTVDKKSLLTALQKFKERWGLELTFRIEVSGSKISKRIVDCQPVKGAWKGKRFEYSKDLIEITKQIDASQIKTAVYALGREIPDSEGVRETLASGVWVQGVDGAPLNKPLDEKILIDPVSTAIWGKPLKAGDSSKQPLVGFYENNESTDVIDLLWEAYVWLASNNEPKISYQAKVIDLYQILGLEAESVDLGDTGAVIDRDLGLEIQARIIEYEEDLDNPENDNLVLGNFEPKFTDFTKKLESLEETAYIKGDPIPASWINTAFGFAQDAITAGGGTVIMNEGEGILIIDNPENPQQAIKLNAGQIALANSRDVQTNTYNWRNFGTGTGWLADLVETSFLRFERSSGGVLSLGGAENGNGQMMVYDASGNIVADLSATQGGFSRLYVADFKADNVINYNKWNRNYYVNPTTGNDNNDGKTLGTAFKSLMQALNAVPRHNDGIITIYITANANFNEDFIYIEGFYGAGTLKLMFQSAVVNGMVYIRSNNHKIEMYNAFVHQIFGTPYLSDGTITIQRTHDVYLKDVQVYSRRNVDFGVKVRSSYCIIESCNFYDATTAGVEAEFGGIIDMYADNYGSGAWSGIRAVGTGRIAVHNTTVPLGTVNTEVINGGSIIGIITNHVAGTPTTLPAPPVTTRFPATATRSWNTKTSWATNNDFIYQGEFSQKKTNAFGGIFTEYYGNWKGCIYFNNTNIANVITGKTLLSARLKLRRLGYGGYSGAYTADLWTITSGIAQAGVSEPAIDFHIGGGTNFYWGEDNYIEVPAWVVTALSNGSYGGLCLHSANGTNYMIMDAFAELEVTYK